MDSNYKHVNFLRKYNFTENQRTLKIARELSNKEELTLYNFIYSTLKQEQISEMSNTNSLYLTRLKKRNAFIFESIKEKCVRLIIKDLEGVNHE